MEIWVYNQLADQREVVKVESDDISIGRDENNDVCLRSPFVSRCHARIVLDAGSYYIEASGLNAVVVAKKELTTGQRRKIEYGDEIGIGEYSIYMMEPSIRRLEEKKSIRTPRKRVLELERRIHADLLERLNLRVTARAGGADEQHVALVRHNLMGIIESCQDSVDDEMSDHLVREFLWRQVVSDLARRCTGKLMYGYGFEESDLLMPRHEEVIARIVSNTISDSPLGLRPHSFKSDVATLEADWDRHQQSILPQLSPDLRDYIVRMTISKDVEDVVLGYGPLQDLLEMPNVNEIMVVGKDRIYIEKDGSLQDTGRSFFSDDIVQSIIERIITPVGRRIDRSSPLVDARLPDGSRVNAVINPLSLSGPTLTIRKFARIPFTIDDLIERGTITTQTAAFLRACVMGRKNMIISGGTGSGKTTTLNVLSTFISSDERIVTIEDSAELQLPQEHLVRLETRPANVEGKGAYTIRDLVRNALRMRPDRLIVGECRGPEALDMLQAMNTGHDGSLTTIHANTPQDTIMRVETMVLTAIEMPVRAIREQVVAALDVIVQISRMADGSRRVTHVSEICGIDPDTGRVITEDIFVLPNPRRRGGNIADVKMRHTGYIPTFAEDLIEQGFLSIEVFT